MKCLQILFYLHLVFIVSAAILHFSTFPFHLSLGGHIQIIPVPLIWSSRKYHPLVFFSSPVHVFWFSAPFFKLTITQTLKRVCPGSLHLFQVSAQRFYLYLLHSFPPFYLPSTILSSLLPLAAPQSLVQHKMPSVWFSGDQECCPKKKTGNSFCCSSKKTPSRVWDGGGGIDGYTVCIERERGRRKEEKGREKQIRR